MRSGRQWTNQRLRSDGHLRVVVSWRVERRNVLEMQPIMLFEIFVFPIYFWRCQPFENVSCTRAALAAHHNYNLKLILTNIFTVEELTTHDEWHPNLELVLYMLVCCNNLMISF